MPEPNISDADIRKVNEWWSNLPDITKLAIYEDYRN